MGQCYLLNRPLDSGQLVKFPHRAGSLIANTTKFYDITYEFKKYLIFPETGLPPAVNVCPTRSMTPSAVGRIHSPGFAAYYGPNLDCKLTLNVAPNQEVEVSYNYHDINCKSVTITILSNNSYK